MAELQRQMVVRKTGLDRYTSLWLEVVHHAAWMRDSIHLRFVPHIRQISENGYEYSWINGRPPRSYNEFRDAATWLWGLKLPGFYKNIEIADEVAKVLRPCFIDPEEYSHRFEWHPVGRTAGIALRDLPLSEFTPVAFTHGDMTFSNVIVGYDGLGAVLIDPGNHRGLCCRELDESKIMQSYDGFEAIYRGIVKPIHTVTHVIKPRRVHHLLQISHYVRLLKHVTCQESREFAELRISQLADQCL